MSANTEDERLEALMRRFRICVAAIKTRLRNWRPLFPGRGNAALPGDWESGIDYLRYAIPFPDWNECIGYSPGA